MRLLRATGPNLAVDDQRDPGEMQPGIVRSEAAVLEADDRILMIESGKMLASGF